MPHLLIVDDDDDYFVAVDDLLQKALAYGERRCDGATMFAALERQPIDLVILDVMLPREDGFSLCKKLRAASRVPVIMLLRVTDHTDRTVGLELGADDYVTSPSIRRELLARVKAVLRRTAETLAAPAPAISGPIMCFGDWRLDVARRELRPPTIRWCCCPAENSTSCLPLSNTPSAWLTRDQLPRFGARAGDAAHDRSIDTLVSRLRHKLAAGSKAPSVIRTVRNGGYVFEAKVTRG